jgi:hypothetical protein
VRRLGLVAPLRVRVRGAAAAAAPAPADETQFGERVVEVFARDCARAAPVEERVAA